jgi:predicted heme/steroid binding protein
MVLADDNTLWIGMTKCTDGERAAAGLSVGCLTMVNIADPASPVATLMPYNSDATGIAAVTGLHKIYTAEGGQVYIYATGGSWTPGTAINNYYVTVTGTAYDVAYMDATSDSDNTDY